MGWTFLLHVMLTRYRAGLMIFESAKLFNAHTFDVHVLFVANVHI